MMSEDRKRRVIGLVTSDKMDKTIVVSIERQIRHPVYKKVIRRTKKYKAHDSENSAKEGDLVQIVEHRPLSSTKRWLLEKVVQPKEA
jgi:small subunit ribosomal protein S17